MQLKRFVGAASSFLARPRAVALFAFATMLVLGCSQANDSSQSPSPPPPDIETLKSALTERDELERTYLLSSYLRELGPEDIPGALAEIERHRVGITADEVRLFMLAWTRFDGSGAFEAARNWPTPWSEILTEQAMQAWGFNDGSAALAEWERLEEGDQKTTLRAALVAGWVGSYDREGVTEFAATVEKSRLRNRLVFRLTGQTMRDGPQAVIAWAESVPNDAANDFKQTVFSHAVGSVARADPELAAQWYEQHIAEPFSEKTLRNLATKWAQHHDARALIAWVETLPLEESREHERADAVRAAMRIWAAADPEEAEKWLETASPSEARDSAIGEFARATIETKPKEALEWVAQIDDDAQRKKNAFRFGRQWFEKDPEAAGSWLAESDFPNEWRQQMLGRRHPGAPSVQPTSAQPDA